MSLNLALIILIVLFILMLLMLFVIWKTMHIFLEDFRHASSMFVAYQKEIAENTLENN